MAAKTGPAAAAGGDPSAPVTTMKAIVQHRYGPPDVLALEETGVPAIGGDDAVIRVHAAGVSYPDGLLGGLRRPRQGVRGTEVAGTVTEAGPRVTDLHPGDEVFGWCGRAAGAGGAGSPSTPAAPRT